MKNKINKIWTNYLICVNILLHAITTVTLLSLINTGRLVFPLYGPPNKIKGRSDLKALAGIKACPGLWKPLPASQWPGVRTHGFSGLDQLFQFNARIGLFWRLKKLDFENNFIIYFEKSKNLFDQLLFFFKKK